MRFPHLGEVGVSNFVFGAFTGWFLGRSPARDAGAREALPVVA